MSASDSAVHGPTPLRSAMKTDDDGDKTPPASGSLKAVQIEEPVPESRIDDEVDPPRRFRAGSTSKRMTGRAASFQLGTASSRSSLSESSPALVPVDGGHKHRHQYYSEKLLAQVGEWLERERAKVHNKKSEHRRPRHRKSASPPKEKEASVRETAPGEAAVGDAIIEPPPTKPRHQRTDSIDSQSSDISLDKLQRILEDSMSSMGLTSLPNPSSSSNSKPSRPRRRLSSRPLNRTASSDTDYVDGDAIVPSCDAFLDNSKTLSYTGGNASTDNLAASSSTDDLGQASSKAEKDREAWISFRNEIIRITHTLRLKGWRRVPLGSGETIGVERLSGALTNAVYVVKPPAEVPDLDGRAPPTKILLRIYGPQVEHLIDRENELKVLGRLARKKIGPRLLGTFQNGRFEQFFNAITLTPTDLRDPDTSKQIAKRMRELHEGIDLLAHERDDGPGVWKNWDAWHDNVARIITFLDKQIESNANSLRRNSVIHAWKTNGYVCGVPWQQFRDAVVKYREYLYRCYNGKRAVNDQLVFAHSDTQYGNILRVVPENEKSPFLQAANKHKQLIVIDFEYSAANTPGLEFVNHFTEWTYNYHDPVTSYACNSSRYPNPDEQKRFLKAYVDHRPQFPGASGTPRMTPSDSGTSSIANTPSFGPTTSSNSIADFMLDARVPAGGWSAAERARDEDSDRQVKELMEEARLWRPANSAMWVAWGIVQAKVPGLDGESSDILGDNALEEDDEMGVDEFDYLSYAQERALFFWGDCVQMGIVKAEELPEMVRSKLKIVEY